MIQQDRIGDYETPDYNEASQQVNTGFGEGQGVERQGQRGQQQGGNDLQQKVEQGVDRAKTGIGDFFANLESDQPNVGMAERHVSLIAGTYMVTSGLKKMLRGQGLMRTLLGAGLLYRGLSGSCPLYKKLGIDSIDSKAVRNAGNAIGSAVTSATGAISSAAESLHITGGRRKGNEPSADPSAYNGRSIHVEQSVTISRPASECYAFWRDLETLPQIMSHLKEVKVLDDKRSHWVAKAPLGFDVQWDAEIINDEQDKLIAWRSIGSATVDNSGSVRFVETSNGMTEVKVTLDYIPPAGKVGSVIAKLFGEEPNQTVKSDLQKFKQLMETGEVASNAGGSPRG
jgi:uncharacterized membrane protein